MIEVRHLTKKYGNHTAVSDLSFTVENGRIYGLLGPNGAGKSTTMNIMTGCLSATDGEVRIDNYDIFEEAQFAKRLIGYLPEQPPLYQEMTPVEYLEFVAAAKGVAKSKRSVQRDEIMDLTQINDVKDRLIRNLSKGYKQRVGIAQALLGNPEIIILDEPTVGLDPKQIIEIRDLIKQLGSNHTVILSSHILPEVRSVCDHIMIISRGNLVASDSPDNLEKLFAGTSTVELLVKGTDSEVDEILESMPEITSYTSRAKGSGMLEVTIETEKNLDIREKIFFAFAQRACPILSMNQKKASLEDVFIELTSEENKPETNKDGKGL